jgi:hypothetical protein
VGFVALGEERERDERHARSDLSWPAMRRGGQERQCAGLWKRRSAWTTLFSSSTDYEMENRVEESRLCYKAESCGWFLKKHTLNNTINSPHWSGPAPTRVRDGARSSSSHSFFLCIRTPSFISHFDFPLISWLEC